MKNKHAPNGGTRPGDNARDLAPENFALCGVLKTRRQTSARVHATSAAWIASKIIAVAFVGIPSENSTVLWHMA